MIKMKSIHQENRMYRFLEKIWDQGTEIYFYLLKFIFREHFEYDLYLLENSTEIDESLFRH